VRVLPLLLLAACGGARWRVSDTVAQAAVSASLAVDYAQTRAAMSDGRGEVNPIMGDGGERVSPELYFAACAAGSAVAARALPRPWRRLFQGAIVAAEAAVIASNWSAGYAVAF
jgi:hypothetical protein